MGSIDPTVFDPASYNPESFHPFVTPVNDPLALPWVPQSYQTSGPPYTNPRKRPYSEFVPDLNDSTSPAINRGPVPPTVFQDDGFVSEYTWVHDDSGYMVPDSSSTLASELSSMQPAVLTPNNNDMSFPDSDDLDSSLTSWSAVGIMAFPEELRKRIYQTIFEQCEHRQLSSLFQVSRQVREEAMAVYLQNQQHLLIGTHSLVPRNNMFTHLSLQEFQLGQFRHVCLWIIYPNFDEVTALEFATTFCSSLGRIYRTLSASNSLRSLTLMVRSCLDIEEPCYDDVSIQDQQPTKKQTNVEKQQAGSASDGKKANLKIDLADHSWIISRLRAFWKMCQSRGIEFQISTAPLPSHDDETTDSYPNSALPFLEIDSPLTFGNGESFLANFPFDQATTLDTELDLDMSLDLPLGSDQTDGTFELASLDGIIGVKEFEDRVVTEFNRLLTTKSQQSQQLQNQQDQSQYQMCTQQSRKAGRMGIQLEASSAQSQSQFQPQPLPDTIFVPQSSLSYHVREFETYPVTQTPVVRMAGIGMNGK